MDRGVPTLDRLTWAPRNRFHRGYRHGSTRKRHRLSHAHVQLDNHRQERWKVPLPQFIEDLYAKRFSRERPDVVKTIEEIARHRVEPGPPSTEER